MTGSKISSFDAVLDDARAKLIAVFDASPSLQAEFIRAEFYVAYALSCTDRVLAQKAALRHRLDSLDAEAAYNRYAMGA